MSEKLTRIRITRKGESGFWEYLDWGEKTREEMVVLIRAQATRRREEADQIDATADDDFEVDVVRGPAIQKHVRKVP